MAEWVCSKCGYTRDSRCKPKVCPECDASGAFDKKEDTMPASKVPARKAPAKVPAKKAPAKVPATKPAAKVPAKKAPAAKKPAAKKPAKK